MAERLWWPPSRRRTAAGIVQAWRRRARLLDERNSVRGRDLVKQVGLGRERRQPERASLRAGLVTPMRLGRQPRDGLAGGRRPLHASSKWLGLEPS